MVRGGVHHDEQPGGHVAIHRLELLQCPVVLRRALVERDLVVERDEPHTPGNHSRKVQVVVDVAEVRFDTLIGGRGRSVLVPKCMMMLTDVVQMPCVRADGRRRGTIFDSVSLTGTG